MPEKRRGLGRGLQDLLPTTDWLKRDDIQLFYASVDRLSPNPYQPRQLLDNDGMDDLTRSIAEKGILQPIIVSRTKNPDHYQIIAGERRWKAAKLAGLSEVPVLLRETTSAEVLEIALIENVQRRDLNCVEEALAYQRLQDEFHLTQQDIAQRVGKDRSTVANLLRLLQLPPDIQEDILNGKLSMGHAKALLASNDPDEQRRLRDTIISRNLSVRQTEFLAAQKHVPPKAAQPLPPQWASIQDTLRSHLSSQVVLRRKGRKGSIVIPFDSDQDLQRLLTQLGVA